MARGIKAGEAMVKVFADRADLKGSLNQARAELRAFAAGIGNIGKGMMVGAAAIVGPMLGAAKLFGSMGDSIAKMSKRTGVGVEALSELQYVASQTGTDIGALELGLRRMQRSIYDAGRGLSTQVDALRDLGLSYEDLAGKAPEEQFKLLADRMNQVSDATQQAALAQALFGRSGTMLLPMFQQGAAGISKLQEDAKALGLTISGDAAKAAEDFSDTLDRLGKVLKMAAFQVGSALAPTLIDLARKITEVAGNTAKWIKENSGAVVVVGKLAAVVGTLGVGLWGVSKALRGVELSISAVTAVTKIAHAAGLASLPAVIAAVTAAAPWVALAAVIAACGLKIAKTAGEVRRARQETEAMERSIARARAAGGPGEQAKMGPGEMSRFMGLLDTAEQTARADAAAQQERRARTMRYNADALMIEAETLMAEARSETEAAAAKRAFERAQEADTRATLGEAAAMRDRAALMKQGSEERLALEQEALMTQKNAALTAARLTAERDAALEAADFERANAARAVREAMAAQADQAAQLQEWEDRLAAARNAMEAEGTFFGGALNRLGFGSNAADKEQLKEMRQMVRYLRSLDDKAGNGLVFGV